MLSNKICVQLNKEEGTIDLKLGRLVSQRLTFYSGSIPWSHCLFWVDPYLGLIVVAIVKIERSGISCCLSPLRSTCGFFSLRWVVADQTFSAPATFWAAALSVEQEWENLGWKFSKPDFSFCRGIWKSKLTTVVAAAALIPNKTVYPIWKCGSERDLSRAATTCQSATSQLF